MRMAFGLAGALGMLVAVVLILKYTLPHEQKVLHQLQTQVKPQVQQIAGYDTNGRPASETITLDSQTRQGKFTGVIVTSVTAGGAMEKHFGLKKGDSIVDIGPLSVKDMDSASAAKDMLVDAFQRSQPIVVIRNEQRITLPVAAPAPAGKGTANADPLKQQLDAIHATP